MAGPVKVTTKGGKKLYVVCGGKLLTINTDKQYLKVNSKHASLNKTWS